MPMVATRRGARADGLAGAVAPLHHRGRARSAEIRSRFTADRADEEETAATIRTVRRETGDLIDPHTAVGDRGRRKGKPRPRVPMVVLSTAHPAKFPAAVEAACGVAPATAGLARRS